MASIVKSPGVGATSRCQPIRVTHHVDKATRETRRLVPRKLDDTDRSRLAEVEREAERALSILPCQRQLEVADEVPRGDPTFSVSMDTTPQPQGCVVQLGRLSYLSGMASIGDSWKDTGPDRDEPRQVNPVWSRK